MPEERRGRIWKIYSYAGSSIPDWENSVRVEKDYEEFLRLLNKHKVRYCITGSFAVGIYGYARYTKDIDVVIEPSKENAGRILKALEEFGFGKVGLKESDFTKKGNIIQLGYEPVRIDIMNSLSGVGFGEIWRTKKKMTFGNTRVFFIGKKELLKTKMKAARKQDILDISRIK